MKPLDWALVVIPLIGLMALALYTRRFVRGVVDFIAAGRCAGRYLLANAGAEAGSGVTNTVSHFQRLMICGFVGLFWDKLIIPVALVLSITGFAVYRYRETRCLTIAQFFEQRYSRSFRIFMGCLAFLAGILNYGVFPYVSARFFQAFLNIPEHVDVWGIHVSTFLLFMGIYLSISCMLILFGGQVTLIVTDCVEGIFTHLVYIVVIIVLMCMISWTQILDVLTGVVPAGTSDAAAKVMAIPKDYSPVNPFDAFSQTNFSPIYTMLGVLGTIYGVMSWQGGHGFRSAARSPHEGRMANVLGQWRVYARGLVLLVLVICTVTFLRHPDFAERAKPVKDEVASKAQPGENLYTTYDSSEIPSAKWANDKSTDATKRRNVPQIQQQQVIPIGLSHLLPTGIKGLFLLVMILGLFAGDGSHLISWSSIFIQDVVVPLRGGRPLTPESHLRLLRIAAVGTAAWAFLFSWLMPLQIDIMMWWGITGAIYMTGAGAVIIGGLYWRRATAAGAWASVVIGSSLSIIALTAKRTYPHFFSELAKRCPKEFDLSNEAWQTFFIMLSAVGSFVIISLLTCKQPVDMDRLLHRGKYRVEEDQDEAAPQKKRGLLARLMGIDGNYTRGDRWISGFIFWWSMFCVALNVGLVIWHYVIGGRYPHLRMTHSDWAHVWLWYGLIIPFLFAAGTLVWFSIGGFKDLKYFFHALRTMKRDAHDDGTVPVPALPVEEKKEEAAVKV